MLDRASEESWLGALNAKYQCNTRFDVLDQVLQSKYQTVQLPLRQKSCTLRVW